MWKRFLRYKEMYYKNIYARVISIGGNSDILNANDIINIKVEETVWLQMCKQRKEKKESSIRWLSQ